MKLRCRSLLRGKGGARRDKSGQNLDVLSKIQIKILRHSIGTVLTGNKYSPFAPGLGSFRRFAIEKTFAPESYAELLKPRLSDSIPLYLIAFFFV